MWRPWVAILGLAVCGQVVAGTCVMESARKIPLVKETDVLVVGGSSGAYPGGELEISSATQGGTAAPLLSAHPFAFASGKAKLRVTGADLLDEHTFGPSKTLVESTAPIAAAPELELVASDGTPVSNEKGIWRVFLTDGGRKLKFGPVVGTRILVK